MVIKLCFTPTCSRYSRLYSTCFKKIRSKHVAELEMKLTLLQHQETGAELWHIERDDPTFAFGVGFKTPVSNNTGVPHILEHTVLCGSKEFPVRDPFFKMLNRSLSTFMNAMTFHDFTLYPFSSLNAADFRNLLSVYLDAVFQPNLDKYDFAQEGWRLEPININDHQSEIDIKGVVYNEMKGVLSDAANLFSYKMDELLFKGSIYSFNSGGDPADIPKLTHSDLVEYHGKFYSPALAKFFFYGPQALLESSVFPQISRILNKTKSKPTNEYKFNHVPTLNGPISKEITCPFDPSGDPDKQVRFSLGFITNPPQDVYQSFAFMILNSLLLNGSSSPLHKALIDSGLAPSFAPGTGYCTYSYTSFKIGVQGISRDQIDNVEQVILNVLRKCSKEGFSQEAIDARINQFEYNLKHVTSSFGVSFIQSIAKNVFHNVNVFESCEISEYIKRLKADSRIFQELITKYLVENHKVVRLIMSPDKKYFERNLEKVRVSELTKNLSDQEKLKIAQEGQQLAKRQDQVVDLSVLPCLSIDQVEKKEIEYAVKENRNSTIYTRQTNTNGISYLWLNSVLNNLPMHLLPLLPLYTMASTWLGTTKHTAEQLDHLFQLKTGYFTSSPMAKYSLNDPNKHEISITQGAGAIQQNFDYLCELVRDVQDIDFSQISRLKMLINMTTVNMVNSIAQEGSNYANMLSRSFVRPSLQTLETWNGLTQIKYLLELSRRENIENVVKDLKLIGSLAKQAEKRLLIVNSNGEVPENAIKLVNSASSSQYYPSFPQVKKKLFVPMPFGVGYCSSTIPTIPYRHKDSPVLLVISQLLTSNYLHKHVREKGGAYGGSAMASTVHGTFTFSSYRDPQCEKSIQVFQDAIEWLCRQSKNDQALSDQSILEAKLRVLSMISKPVDPNFQGVDQVINGISYQDRQNQRDKLFKVSADDIQRVSREHLLKNTDKQSSVIIGPQDHINNLSKEWQIMEIS